MRGNYPFKTIPAIKIAKLAVSQSGQKTYKGIGSYISTGKTALSPMGK
jgi:hypothetical protein